MANSFNPRTPPPQNLAANSFWGALDAAERQAFRSLAHERTFAAGARLMREGEAADYVIVILSGWSRIFVRDGDVERVIAERGPGQLVGERAALQVSVRSATVVALETVQALVMKTEDFAAFVSAHPAVLGIVEGQVYQRLTEDPGQHGPERRYHERRSGLPEPGPMAQPPARPGEFRPDQRAGSPPARLYGENCTIVLSDVAAFGALTRNDDDRLIIRKELLAMTYAALPGDLWDACRCEDRGDGLLLVAPPSIPTTKVVECVLAALPGALRRHNRTYGPAARIQLRLAVDVGPVVSDPLGVSGEAIIRTARLLDAQELKKGVAEKDANLGVIVSSFVYDNAIRQCGGSVDPADYRKVHVQVKETSAFAWMQLIDPQRPARPPCGELELIGR